MFHGKKRQRDDGNRPVIGGGTAAGVMRGRARRKRALRAVQSANAHPEV
jgi:hypothetical protein